ncbi:MAG: hypothetical protein DRO18_04840 [Thermoprotei archaeon]|nr:MAG: hypothetical protein DRO18_04840 [Thermoprotei archaeon]
MSSIEGAIHGLSVNARERERVLRRLRKAIRESLRDNELKADVKASFTQLRELRSYLSKALQLAIDSCKEASEECLDLKTLLEFNALISLDKEEELLLKLMKLVKSEKGEILRQLISDLENDLRDIDELKKRVLNYLEQAP